MSKSRFNQDDEDGVLVSVAKETVLALDKIAAGNQTELDKLKHISDRLANAIKWNINYDVKKE